MEKELDSYSLCHLQRQNKGANAKFGINQAFCLFLSFLLILESLPSHALTKPSLKDLDSNPEKAKSLSEAVFDGKKTSPPSLTPSLNNPARFPEESPSPLFLASALNQALDACKKGQSIHGGSCTTTPLNIPKDNKGPYHTTPRNISQGEETTPKTPESLKACGFLTRLFDPTYCRQVDERLKGPQEKQLYSQGKETSPEPEEKDAREQAYNNLSSAGKFGFWLTNSLSIPAFTGGLALLGYLLSGGSLALVLGSLGLVIGAFSLNFSYTNPGSFHEALGTTVLSPFALSYGILSGLISTLSFGLVSPSWGDSNSQRGSKVLYQLHKASKTAAQVTTILGGAALGLGALGVPGLAAASVLVGTPIAATAGIYTGTSALVQAGRWTYRKLLTEPKQAKEEEISQLHTENNQLASQANSLTKELESLGVASNPEISLPHPGNYPGDEASQDKRLSWIKQANNYNSSLVQNLQRIKEQALKAIKDEPHLQKETASLWGHFKDLGDRALGPHNKNWLKRYNDLLDVYQKKVESLKDPLERFQYIQHARNWLQNFIDSKERVAVKAERERVWPVEGAPPNISPYLANRVELKNGYLDKEGLDVGFQRFLWEEVLYKSLGSNPWSQLARSDLNTIRNRMIEEGRDATLAEVTQGLDLRYLIAHGPYDDNNQPLLGQLQILQDLPEDSPWRPLETPLVVAPAKLEPRFSKDKPLIGAFGWTRDNNTTFHSGVDIKAQWAIELPELPGDQQRGFGVPIGLRREVTIIEVGYQRKGHGNRVIAQDTQEPNTFYILGHAGEDKRWEKLPEKAIKKNKRLSKLCQEADSHLTNPECGRFVPDPEMSGKAGILVNEADTIPAFRPLIVMGHSGNAATANPKDSTADTHVHLEKHIIPDEAVAKWKEGKKVKRQYSMTFAQLRDGLEQAMRDEPVKIKGYGTLRPSEAMNFLQLRLRELLFNAKCDTDGDGKVEPRCYARNPLE